MSSIKERTVFEIALILACIGLTCLLCSAQDYQTVVLNLFFLPVVLGAYFLGRYHGGMLALFCAISAFLVSVFNLAGAANDAFPLVIALSVTVWAAALGLTALLVGSLSDQRAAKVRELHEAYVGVAEVLSQYLQSAHPRLKAWSIRVAELSQAVAAAMKLTPRQIDDIRVAALLYDLGNLEVAAKVIRRAAGAFEGGEGKSHQSTIPKADRMASLGSVLSGAVPLLLRQGEAATAPAQQAGPPTKTDAPLGSKIIRAARAYLALAEGPTGGPRVDRAEILQRLRADDRETHDPAVLQALDKVVARSKHIRGSLFAIPSTSLEIPLPTSGAPL